MTITFSCLTIWLKLINKQLLQVVFAFCFATQSSPREILDMCWAGFSNSLPRFVYCLINNHKWLLIKPYYILVINLSVSICYLEYRLEIKQQNILFRLRETAFVASQGNVLNTNTHTYQSFKLLKSLCFLPLKWITFWYFVSRFALTRSALYRALKPRQH